MRNALKQLLNALDVVAETHGEIYDTMVREELRDALHRSFVMAEPEAELPGSFGMFGDEGNAAVCSTLEAFLSEPAVLEMMRAATPQQRLDAFEDGSVLSDQGVPYDEYFGHVGEL